MTMNNASSFAAFQVISLLLDEYVLLAIESQFIQEKEDEMQAKILQYLKAQDSGKQLTSRPTSCFLAKWTHHRHEEFQYTDGDDDGSGEDKFPAQPIPHLNPLINDGVSLCRETVICSQEDHFHDHPPATNDLLTPPVSPVVVSATRTSVINRIHVPLESPNHVNFYNDSTYSRDYHDSFGGNYANSRSPFPYAYDDAYYRNASTEISMTAEHVSSHLLNEEHRICNGNNSTSSSYFPLHSSHQQQELEGRIYDHSDSQYLNSYANGGNLGGGSSYGRPPSDYIAMFSSNNRPTGFAYIQGTAHHSTDMDSILMLDRNNHHSFNATSRLTKDVGGSGHPGLVETYVPTGIEVDIRRMSVDGGESSSGSAIAGHSDFMDPALHLATTTPIKSYLRHQN